MCSLGDFKIPSHRLQTGESRSPVPLIYQRITFSPLYSHTSPSIFFIIILCLRLSSDLSKSRTHCIFATHLIGRQQGLPSHPTYSPTPRNLVTSLDLDTRSINDTFSSSHIHHYALLISNTRAPCASSRSRPSSSRRQGSRLVQTGARIHSLEHTIGHPRPSRCRRFIRRRAICS
jgi:hypothetical protein